MTDEPSYYEVSGENGSGRSLAPGELERALGSWVCPRCQFVLPGCGPIDIVIGDEGPIDTPLAFLYVHWLGLVWNEFLAPLGPELVARDLHLGRVAYPDGRVVEGWSTFHGRHRVLIRGSKKGLDYSRCQKCGRKYYNSFGPYYLCPPPPEHEILTTDCGLILRHELFSLLKIKGQRKRVTIRRLAVREYLNDRLPINLVDPS
jgi:hypothetical protein